MERPSYDPRGMRPLLEKPEGAPEKERRKKLRFSVALAGRCEWTTGRRKASQDVISVNIGSGGAWLIFMGASQPPDKGVRVKISLTLTCPGGLPVKLLAAGKVVRLSKADFWRRAVQFKHCRLQRRELSV